MANGHRLWLWRRCDPAARAAARWPLWQPMLPFTAVSLVSALASDHPVTALSVCKGPPARHCPLRDRRRAGRALGRHRLLSALPVV